MRGANQDNDRYRSLPDQSRIKQTKNSPRAFCHPCLHNTNTHAQLRARCVCVTRRVPSAMHIVATIDFLNWRAAMRAHPEILRFPLFIFLHPQQEVSHRNDVRHLPAAVRIASSLSAADLDELLKLDRILAEHAAPPAESLLTAHSCSTLYCLHFFTQTQVVLCSPSVVPLAPAFCCGRHLMASQPSLVTALTSCICSFECADSWFLYLVAPDPVVILPLTNRTKRKAAFVTYHLHHNACSHMESECSTHSLFVTRLCCNANEVTTCHQSKAISCQRSTLDPPGRGQTRTSSKLVSARSRS